jgi:hypothetical protein
MSVRVGLVGWLLAVACASCGRSTHNANDDVATPTAGAPTASGGSGQAGTGAGRAGSGQAGTSAGQAGTGSSQPTICEGSGPVCLRSCGAFGDVTESECVDSRWLCPEGTRLYEACPANACVRRTQNCCAPSGHVELPACNDDGTIGECPDGFDVATDSCLPQGVDIQDCAELESGEACTDPELVCYTSKCGRNCYCKEDEAGQLTWSCFAIPC